MRTVCCNAKLSETQTAIACSECDKVYMLIPKEEQEADLPEPKWHKVFTEDMERARDQGSISWLFKLSKHLMEKLKSSYEMMGDVKRPVKSLGMAILFDKDATEKELKIAEYLLRTSGDYWGDKPITKDNQDYHIISAEKVGYPKEEVEEVLSDVLDKEGDA